ncbi:MAG TPA: aminotransferase class V-fold PLP-dependent enzyme [Crocinitomix sp.]|nr:aminotransferase class V-fold PLP-dependent enzyme [Crocinitomix sp.]
MLEKYFSKFRQNIIGIDKAFETPYGLKQIVYADWTASGRLYKGIEDRLRNQIMPLVANTHTETTVTGTAMTQAYHLAKDTIKSHVNANQNDVLLFSGTGMTGVINKLQRILGIKYPENPNVFLKDGISIDFDTLKLPVVFITHMEHHSNQTSWLETASVVEIIGQTKDGLVDLEDLKRLLKKHENRKIKIASVTACSNVTGIKTPYHKIAEIMHQNNGYCFVDFACSAPYVDIDMHPENESEQLDAVFLSPHKFLGGPATSGVMVFNKNLYNKNIPDNPGGGTVTFTDPWGNHGYIKDIETREDGGTPGFLQGIKTALAIKLKEKMGVDNILKREEELINIVFNHFDKMGTKVHVLADKHRDRLGVFSFYVEDIHYNLFVKILNDRFGIQTRGGCACAGTYGHILLNVNKAFSQKIVCEILKGNNSEKPGWVRMSIHPTMTNSEVEYIMVSIKAVMDNIKEWEKDYTYNPTTNEFIYDGNYPQINVKEWFKL